MEKKDFFYTDELPKASSGKSVPVMNGKADAAVKFINISDIYPDPQKTPKKYKESELAALALDILKNGLENPPTLVAAADKIGKYRLISGEKRFRACLLARAERIPCTVIFPKGISKAEEELIMPPRNYFEEARIFEEAICRGTHTEETIAELAGVPREEIRARLSLLVFSRDERALLIDRKLPAKEARLLASMGKTMRKSFLECIARGDEIGGICARIRRATESGALPKNVKYNIRDIGFFLNSINRAVDIMRKSGTEIGFASEKNDSSTVLTITIPETEK